MTTLQQVLFEVEEDYLGHPYYVSGHALYSALARRVDDATRRALCVSHGVFLPGEYGRYPDWHSASGGAGSMGGKLHPVESYEDLFLFREPAQRWLLESRPRDAHNVQDLRGHGGRVTYAASCWFGRPPEVRNSKRSVDWYVHCYLHGDGRSRGGEAVPVAEETLDGLRVGGGRNYGFGELSVADTQIVDLEALDYDGLAGHDAYVLELVSPYVLASEYPGADDQSVPWWWAPVTAEAGGVAAQPVSDAAVSEAATHRWPTPRDRALGFDRQREYEAALRRREERFVEGDQVYRVETVDHGQVVGYAGDDLVETARNGVTRVGTHSRFGFGECRVRPAGTGRVPDRGRTTDGADATRTAPGRAGMSRDEDRDEDRDRDGEEGESREEAG